MKNICIVEVLLTITKLPTNTQTYVLNNINMEKILHLDFCEIADDMEYSAVWFTAAFLLAIWERRTSGTRIGCYEIRAEIEGKNSLLIKRNKVFRTC